jgi:hypothetical protein
MAFCVVEDLELFLQISIPLASRPAASRAITEATAAIQNYCQQVLAAVANETITLDCHGGARLFLPELPVTTLTSVTENGALLVKDTDYKLAQNGILHRLWQPWGYGTDGIQMVKVVYSHGYAAIPEDIVSIATRAASRAYQAGLRAAETGAVTGVTATTLGDYSVTYGGGAAAEGVMGASAAPLLLQSEKELLDKYRV